MQVTEKESEISKDSLVDTISELNEFCSREALAGEQLAHLSSKLTDKNFVITVLGEFNRGKSSFINSLLGKPVLPVGVTPTTATINIVSYSEVPFATVSYQDGRSETYYDSISESLLKLNAAEIS